MPKKLSECEKGYRRWIGDGMKPKCEACKDKLAITTFMGQRMCEPCKAYWKGFHGDIIMEEMDDL